MTRFEIKCIKCGREFAVESRNDDIPSCCAFCGASLKQSRSAPANAASDTGAAAPESGKMRVVTFMNSERIPCCTGRIPEGYSPFAKLEANNSNMDTPILVWACARNKNGREMFCRINRNYFIDKSMMNQSERFMPFDEYVNTNAVSLLETQNIRILKNFPLSEQTQQLIRAELENERAAILSRSNGNMYQAVIQGLYGGGGARLYSAEINGRKKYLVMNAVIIGSEHGGYSPMAQSIMQKRQTSMQQLQMGFGFGMPQVGYGMPGQMMIDTDPDTPFGMHRTDGLDRAAVSWRIDSFAGFLSDQEPSDKEIENFFDFISSLKIHRTVANEIEQIKQQFIAGQMQAQDAAWNAHKKIMNDRNRSWEKQKSIMQSMNDHIDSISQQMRESNDEAFDHRSRLEHERTMGVNTFTNTEGETIEHTINDDRVFQLTNDPDVIVGVNGYMDVPSDWTELEKLK